MVLLVDGYNVIKYLLPHNREEHDAQREWFIARLARYARAKQGCVTEVTAVFDGGLFRHRQREVRRGVVVVFAGHAQSADDVLVEYADRHGAGSVVVTNDRELRRRCEEHGAEVITVDTFDELCSRVCDSHDTEPQRTFRSITITKMTEESDPELDALMEAGSLAKLPAVFDDDAPRRKRQGKKLSKAERARQRLHKKLG